MWRNHLLLTWLALAESVQVEPRRRADNNQGQVLDYLEIGTNNYETLSDARPRARGASVDMVNDYVEELKKRAPAESGKIFVNAAITNDATANSVKMYEFKARYVANSKRCREFSKLRHSEDCQCKTTKIQDELKRMGVRIRSKDRCLSAWALASHSVGEPFYEQAKIIQPITKAKLLTQEHVVPMLTPAHLLRKINVSNALSLKVDVEGFDAKVVAAFAEHMASQAGQKFRPTEFQWECKHLTLADEATSIATISKFGYSCSRLEFDCFCNRTAGGPEPSQRLTPALGEPVHSRKE